MAAVEAQRDTVRFEEGIERFDDRRRVAGVGRWILGKVRRHPERLPRRIGHRGVVAVGVRVRDGLVRTPEPESVFRVEARNHRVAARGVRQREHARRLNAAQVSLARQHRGFASGRP